MSKKIPDSYTWPGLVATTFVAALAEALMTGVVAAVTASSVRTLAVIAAVTFGGAMSVMLVGAGVIRGRDRRAFFIDSRNGLASNVAYIEADKPSTDYFGELWSQHVRWKRGGKATADVVTLLEVATQRVRQYDQKVDGTSKATALEAIRVAVDAVNWRLDRKWYRPRSYKRLREPGEHG